MSRETLCSVCDYVLDARGKCASCRGVAPRDIALLKVAEASWTECIKHGALPVVGKGYAHRVTWTTQDPKDGRRKITHHEWRRRCSACFEAHDWAAADASQSCKEQIEIPEVIWKAELDSRMARWSS